jgi:hypothetical protein
MTFRKKPFTPLSPERRFALEVINDAHSQHWRWEIHRIGAGLYKRARRSHKKFATREEAEQEGMSALNELIEILKGK